MGSRMVCGKESFKFDFHLHIEVKHVLSMGLE